MICIRIFLIAIFIPIASAAGHADTIKVYFETGEYQLNGHTKYLLDSLAYNDMLIPSAAYDIIGYADYAGSEQENYILSMYRAEHVARYLKGLGITGISTIVGKGEIGKPENSSGYAEDRRVDIVINYKAAAKPVVEININRLKEGEAFELSEIFFEDGRTVLLEKSIPALESLYNTMARLKTLKIQIEGHVHCELPGTYRGIVSKRSLENDETERKFRQELSTARAKTIYNFLEAKGIAGDRIKYIGLGCAGIETHRQNNRRVEIRILEK